MSLFDPVPEVMAALTTISGLSISDGMPDFFVSGDSSDMDWEVNSAIGWFDVDRNASYFSGRTETGTGISYAEKISDIALTFHFYCQNGGDAADYDSSINDALTAIGYIRGNSQTGKEAIGRTQTFHRVIARYTKKVDLYKSV